MIVLCLFCDVVIDKARSTNWLSGLFLSLFNTAINAVFLHALVWGRHLAHCLSCPVVLFH